MGAYENAAAFRQALEQRLIGTVGVRRYQRARKRIVCERMLARLQRCWPGGFLVKGGFAMELRLQQKARMTRDLDLDAAVEMATDLHGVEQEFQRACAVDEGDWFEFKDPGAAEPLSETGGGTTARFRVEARLGGRQFEIVPVDVHLGDPSPVTVDTLDGSDLLRFAGIPAVRLPVVSLEQHFAEKVHAYTRPRGGRMNSRTKDLVDMVLLIHMGCAGPAGAARATIERTFAHQSTHPVPTNLPPPPGEWAEDYVTLAVQVALEERTLESAYTLVRRVYQGIFRR